MRLIKAKSDFKVDKNLVNQLSEKYNLLPEIIEILFMRDIDDAHKIEHYLHPSKKDFHDPFLLKDMQQVVERIRRAINNKEKVLIFGDYDVDGVSATAIMVKYFNQQGIDAMHFMPNRYIDGYGLSCDAIDKIKATQNPDLIITVDCGISCHDEVEYAKSLGIEVIVTDHHDIPDVLPECLTLNAKLPNQDYPFHEICGTGMAFKVVQALEGLDYACQFLPIASIATIADIVPLLDENRAIVTLGLKQMNSAPRGIVKLLEKLDISHPQATDISYKLAPKLNASGRLGDADKSFELYMCENDARINELIDIILDFNSRRQDLCSVVYDECKEKLERELKPEDRCICLYSEAWDSGILGIVAAKLCEEYYRPTFLFSNVDGILTGSGRSIDGVNIHNCLKQTQDILESFGGHTMAAGLKIKIENFDKFKQNMEYILAKDFDASLFVPQKTFDMDLDLNKVTKEFVKQLDVLEPIGSDNPRPRFRIKFAKANATLMKSYPNHLTMSLNNTSTVGFNFGKYKNLINEICTKQAIVELQLDVYRGHESSKMFLKQVVADKNIEVADKDHLIGEYLTQTLCPAGRNFVCENYEKTQIADILSSFDNVFGTLFIVNSKESYDHWANNKTLANKVSAYSYRDLFEDKGHNSFVLNPSLKNNFKNFNNIVFLDPVLNDGYIATLNNLTQARIFRPTESANCSPIQNYVSTERTVCGMYYKAMSNVIEKIKTFESINMLYNLVKLRVTNAKYSQFMFCLKVFQELNIFNIKFNDNSVKINEVKGVESKLELSHLYNVIKKAQAMPLK